MANTRNIIKVAAIAAIVIIPVTFVVFVSRAKWVHKPLDYYGQAYTGPDKSKQDHRVGDISLTDQYGHKVSMKQFDSCIVVASIFFATCKEACPKMNGQIEALAREYRNMKNVRFLSVSIDPETDSVPLLAKYAKQFGAQNYHWQFCTGDKAEIYDWALNELMLAADQKGKNFIHDDKVVILDKQKYIRAILPSGGENKPGDLDAFKRIKDDIENLLYEYRQQAMDK